MKRSTAALFGALASPALIATPLHAQTTTDALPPSGAPPIATKKPGSAALEEVVVTARKRSERVLDIPESIKAVSAAEISAKHIQTIEDIGRQTSNLQLNTRQDLTTNVVIRGIGAYGDVLGVGFSVDNVPNFTDQTMRIEDLQSVEILKGPQGTLYGGSSIGGIVRYVSKKPAFNYDGQAMFEAGSYNSYTASVAQNLPLIADKLALRISAYDHKSDGWVTNSALGINGNPVKDYGIRAALLYQPTDAVTALLTLRHSYIKSGADEYTIVPSVTSYTYDNPLFQPTLNRRVTSGATLEVNADVFAGYRFTSISSYTRALYDLNVDISFTPPGVPGASLFTVPGNRPTEVATQEFRIASPVGGSIDWLAGLYGANIRNVLLNKLGISSSFPSTPPILFNDFNTNRTDTAAFGTVNYHFGRFTLGGGLRVGQTRFRANVFTELGGPPNQTASITTTSVLPKLSLSYKFPNAEILYASVAKGEEPGAVNTASNGPILPYQAETALSYEVGTKGRSGDHRFQYDVAAFYVTNSNHQAQTNKFINGIFLSLIANVGAARTFGAEANVSWRATPDITIGASGGYLNAKWTVADNSGFPLNGLTVPNSPEFTGNANINYTHMITDRLRLNANFDVTYTSSFWWDLNNTPGQKNPAYFLSNARVAVGPDHGFWEVALTGTNLFDTKYWTEYNPTFGPTTFLGAIAAPLQVMGSITLHY